MKPLLSIAFLALYLAGCTSNKPYRTLPHEATEPFRSAHAATIEATAEYSLGFIEFDDQGALWNPRQQADVVAHLRETGRHNGVLLIVFVHGWKHNASLQDGNVQLVRDALTSLYLTEQKTSEAEGRDPRKVMGVYLGWRGLSVTVPLLKEFSFWTRKNTAHEVGYGAVAETFVRLENEVLKSNKALTRARDDAEAEENATASRALARRPRSSMVSVGHSFGGAVVFSSLSGILTDRVLSKEAGLSSGASGLGDLVILINPAFEATKIAPLIEGTHDKPHEMEEPRRPALAILTSKGDNATKIYFPIGRAFSTGGESYRGKLQKQADRTAVGHFGPFITHDLLVKEAQEGGDSVSAAQSDPEVQKSANRVMDLLGRQMEFQRDHDRTTRLEFSETILHPRPNKIGVTPVMVIAVDNEIIHGHNGIATPKFLTFLREFILVFSRDPKSDPGLQPASSAVEPVTPAPGK